MNQSAVKADDTNIVYGQWRLSEPSETERTGKKLSEERRKFEEERRQFEQEKKAFFLEKSMESKRIETERHLFEMKWKVLETELRKLASEKEQVERQRDFYKSVNKFDEKLSSDAKKGIISGRIFFAGVGSEQSLKKRYKDLIKIYHPDNMDGDTGAIQVINREYDKLKQQYE